MGSYVSHEYLEEGEVEKRLYQLNIASTASERSCLVVLPTGLGKTAVALLVAVNRLSGSDERALMLAPTKPLVDQHARFFSEVTEVEVERLTGEVTPEEREGLWGKEGPGILVATPQVVENDVISGRADLGEINPVIFDEAHRASGDYPYSWIAEKHARAHGDSLRLGLTASPGNDREEVEVVCDNLALETMEVRSDSSPDVEGYVQETDVEWVKLELPEELEGAADQLRDLLDEKVGQYNSTEGLPRMGKDPNRSDLLNHQRKVQGRISSSSDPPGGLFRAASLVAQALKVSHAVDVLETQGPGPALKYLKKVKEESESSGGSKASKVVADDLRFKKARRTLSKTDRAFPKKVELLHRLRGLDEDSRAIVFTEFRDTASDVVEYLEEVEGIDPVRFVGQSSRGSDKGLSQEEQAEVLEAFEEGEHNVLVGTSVAEEGLDIPATDLVIFYEPVASAIRSVQRKGRTGRSRRGEVVVLMVEDTRDEGVYWASRRREDRMEDFMEDMAGSHDMSEGDDGQASLDSFEVEGSTGSGGEASEGDDREEEGDNREDGNGGEGSEEDGGCGDEEHPVVVADTRETSSGILRELDSLEVAVETESLDVGDFVVGEEVAVERKSAGDFVSSIVDEEGRLFDQAARLKESYPKAVFVVEGEEGLTGGRNVHPNAVRGALSSLLIDFRVPVLRTDDKEETAAMVASLAKREAARGGGRPTLHGGKSSDSLDDQQERMVSSVKGIGGETAERLLEEFGSISAMSRADVDDFSEVDGVGPKRAQNLHRILTREYGSEEDRDEDRD